MHMIILLLVLRLQIVTINYAQFNTLAMPENARHQLQLSIAYNLFLILSKGVTRSVCSVTDTSTCIHPKALYVYILLQTTSNWWTMVLLSISRHTATPVSRSVWTVTHSPQGLVVHQRCSLVGVLQQ